MKSKIHLTLILASLSIVGCQLLKKDKLTLKKLNQKEELQILERRNTLNQQSQLVLIDSSHNDFTLMLWPKGKFTFTLANGFEGEAEKMMIAGKQTQQKVLNIRHEEKRDSTVLKANYSDEKASSTLVKKDKLRRGFNWGWAFCLGISLVIFAIWFFRRIYK